MNESTSLLRHRLYEYLRARCNTKDYLLNQEHRYGSQTSRSELDGIADQEIVISVLNGSLGPTEYLMQ